ncbi:MAG: class I SAM-dependent methyltransferase [Nanoarchaeota archaeon]
MKSKKTTLKDFLEGKLTQDEINQVNRSFEIVGDIAIIEIPKSLDEKSKVIGEALLKVNRNIKTILKKSGIHKGEFRTQKLIYIAGENKKETIYKENGIKLKIDPENVYFSARLSTEREFLMNNLGKKRVLVMFSGSGPYSFVALKKQPNLKRILSLEINPIGHKYALENRELNKNLIKKSDLFVDIKSFLKEKNLPIYEKNLVKIFNDLFVNFYCLDVKLAFENFKLNIIDEDFSFDNLNLDILKLYDFLSNLDKKRLFVDLDNMKMNKEIIYLLVLFSFKFDYVFKINNKKYLFDNGYKKGVLINYLKENIDIEKIYLFDEIFMPLPKDASNFLKEAFNFADSNAIIHMYDFVEEKDFPKLSEKKVLLAAKKYKRDVEIIQTRKVGQYSPRKYRVCCDFKILN